MADPTAEFATWMIDRSGLDAANRDVYERAAKFITAQLNAHADAQLEEAATIAYQKTDDPFAAAAIRALKSDAKEPAA